MIGAYHASNVTITGAGVIDGQGEIWWANCTACHYPPSNDSAFCEIASRPKLIETQFVDGLRVVGSAVFLERDAHDLETTVTSKEVVGAPPAPPFGPPTPPPPPWPGMLTLQNSPFWTVTPSYSQNIHVSHLRILAPMDTIGNTDGVNIVSELDPHVTARQ